MINKKKKPKIHLGLLFFIGLFVFILGILGYVFRLFSWVPVELNEVLPTETNIVIKLQLDEIEDNQEILNTKEFIARLNYYLGKRFSINFSEDISPWIGKQAAFAQIEGGDELWAIEYRSKSKAKTFIQSFVTTDENFTEKEFEDGVLLTPEFSSEIAFGFYHNWLIISPSQTAIEKVFQKEEALKVNPEYKKIVTDIPRKNFFFCFVKIEPLIQEINFTEPAKKYIPLLKTLSQSLPTFGVSLQYEQKEITLNAKILSQEGIFEDRIITKTPNQTMPELAKMVPQDVLFFINGSDLYAKYLHTKNFLSELDPQFALIFEGLLQAQSEEIFGEDFQFEEDFLSKMRGQYAFALDFKDQLKPFINFIFITGFGSEKNQGDISQFHDAIHIAQTQFSPQIEEVDLPDGTTRTELVSAKPEEIAIAKIESGDHVYFSSQNKELEKQFSYGFFGKNLVFATQQEGLESIISVIEKKEKNLSENADFRESVLFKFSPSESYGFLNISKIAPVIQLWKNNEDTENMAQFLRSKFRNLTFSRKVFPGEIFIKAVLSPR